MSASRRHFVAGIAAMATSPSAMAHSTGELADLLGDEERYFQAMDRPTPDFGLSDPDGRPYGPADFLGKVVVLNFIFASCTDVCPLHTDKLAEVQDLVNQTPMKDLVQFVSITTDPASDTPDVLRAYASDRGLDTTNWVLLTTRPGQPQDATRALVREFGHRFDPAADGQQIHSVVTHVIDKAGRWRANFYGLRFQATNLLQFVNALTNDPVAPHGRRGPGLLDRLRGLFD